MTLRGAVIDVDGTVLRGGEAIPGAAEGLDRLRTAGLDRLFCSNNPTKRPETYVDRFAGAGIDVAADEVLTSGGVTTAYLRDRHADDALFPIGAPGLTDQLSAADLTTVDDPDAADCVVVSVDRTFNYDDLTRALWALSDPEVAFVGSDPDVTIPAEERPIPGSGAIVRAVAGVAEREPDAVLGKPSAYAREMVLDRLGVDPGECLVVGDRLDTDIALGARAGMTTALVLTGIADESDLADADVEPDRVLDSLAEIGRVLDGA